ncbi:MAG: hypothetical protein ACREIM_08775 [Nitrospiraceae bacterium]
MISRRDFLKVTGTALVLPWGCARWAGSQSGEVLNDVHSQLNTTRVNGVDSVSSQEDVVQALDRADVRVKLSPWLADGMRWALNLGTDTLSIRDR